MIFVFKYLKIKKVNWHFWSPSVRPVQLNISRKKLVQNQDTTVTFFLKYVY